ncbi:MAG: hypothetical protein EAZ57_10110 [Cytophagales bacterium]|nr:MAG: hypothetical protein EAZ67_05900 [Cytophagales bacterium]TAF59687.1 MAG: hypothetical protein EAZ57_10110 [Cytophagales bacterium]
MNVRLAKFIAIVFHPAFATTVIFLLLGKYYLIPLGGSQYLSFIGIIFVITVLFPLIFIILLRRMSFVKSFELDLRQDRFAPYILSTAIYGCTAYSFYQSGAFGMPAAYTMMNLTALLATLLVVNFFYKVSAHAAGMGGICGLWFAFAYYFVSIDALWGAVLSIVLSGLVLTSRLATNSHGFGQLFLGWFLGFVSVFSIFEWLR